MGEDWDGFYTDFDFQRKLLPANDMVIHSLIGPHETLGGIQFVYKLPTLETAIAINDVVLLSLRNSDLNDQLNMIPTSLASKVKSLRYTANLNTLRLFEFMTFTERLKLYLMMERKHLKHNDYLWHQGKKQEGF